MPKVKNPRTHPPPLQTPLTPRGKGKSRRTRPPSLRSPTKSNRYPAEAPFDDETESTASELTCSYNDTESDRPGPGRLLGNVYSFLGGHLEDFLNDLSLKMRTEPRYVAIRIRRCLETGSPSHGQKMIRKEVDTLLKHAW